MSKLLNVHEILSETAQEAAIPENTLVTTSFKVQGVIKNHAQAICEEHGVTLSAYLRKCCETLVKDYNPASH